MRKTSSADPIRLGWCLAALVLLGALLRLAFLGQQVVGGDEVHVLKALPGSSLAHIFTHYEVNDSSIPITAWCWLLMRTVGLDETGLRLWSWLPGILLVWLVPRATRPWLPAGERLLLALVLAVSPLLVFWSPPPSLSPKTPSSSASPLSSRAHASTSSPITESWPRPRPGAT